VVFFNRDGRVIQILGREQDHRLARAQSMHFAPNGVLWVILTEGLARVEVPSPVSRFEPLLMSAIDYAKPLRYNGHLWMTADGRARRGVYDVDGRLTGFVDDSPPGQFVSALAVVSDELWGSSDSGVFVWSPDGWHPIVTGIDSARIEVVRTGGDRVFYTAQG
jgi:hypothetical protein